MSEERKLLSRLMSKEELRNLLDLEVKSLDSDQDPCAAILGFENQYSSHINDLFHNVIRRKMKNLVPSLSDIDIDETTSVADKTMDTYYKKAQFVEVGVKFAPGIVRDFLRGRSMMQIDTAAYNLYVNEEQKTFDVLFNPMLKALDDHYVQVRDNGKDVLDCDVLYRELEEVFENSKYLFAEFGITPEMAREKFGFEQLKESKESGEAKVLPFEIHRSKNK